MKADLSVRGGKVVFPGYGIRNLDVEIYGGKVVGLCVPNQQSTAQRVLDAKDKLVLPGGIDVHTHLTLGPGIAGYETETRSAALGGITTVLSYLMDGGDLVQKLENEIAAGEHVACGDYGLHPGIVTAAQLESLPKIIDRFGITSFKFFMTARGEEMAYMGVPGNDDGFLFKMLRVVSALPGVIPCVHAENIELAWMLRPEVQQKGDGGLGDWDRYRPDFSEAEATSRVLYFAEKADCPIYIVHITCRDALEAVQRAKARRPGKVFAETCSHYLTLTSENAPFPGGKVTPPLRHADDVEALWGGIADGTIDVVGSDHVPRRFQFKDKSVWEASAGFPGVATLLPIFLTEGVRRGISLEALVERLTSAPAAIFGLCPSKGSLLPGADGDLTLVDPETPVTLSASLLGSDADYTNFEGHVVKYMPTHTVLRGKIVVNEGEYVGEPGVGSYIRRGM
jgi:dihydropyrimidinase